MKIRYPEAGWLPDDLLGAAGENLRLTMRVQVNPIVGELQELRLAKRKMPRLVILPTGSSHVIEVMISKIEKIEFAEINLANSDYTDDDPDEYDRWEPT